MTSAQKASAKRSANRHGRSRPGLWEGVNSSKGIDPQAKKRRPKAKGKTRPGKRSRKRGA